MPYYFYHKSAIWHLNTTFYWNSAQILLRVIIVEKLNNSLWRIFSYFDTRVPTPNEQQFLPFVTLPPWFCSDLSLLNFYYIFIYIFLFRCCHFLRCNEVWVQFISIRGLIQYRGLLIYTHCVTIPNDHPNFSSL